MAGLVGQRLGQYEIVDRLGEGGMATVYRARQLNIKREVAIKVMAANLERDESFVRRFQREAQTLASLSHPHILKIFDYGQQDDMVYLVMELIPGGSLADRIKDGPLALPEAQRLLDEIAQALDYAHLENVIHRDLKPQNVLLDQRGNALLTDFGIAKLLSEATALTQSGVAMGTPAYMAPEQWRGEEIDARTDTYALGVMLFEMLSGGLPFNQSTPFSMMYSHVNEPPPSLVHKNPNLPAGIDQVIDKAMAKDREQRYQSAADMSAAFTAAIKGGLPPVAVQPPSPPAERDRTVAELPIPPSLPPATKVPDDMSGPTMPPTTPPILPTRSPSPTQRSPRNSSRESIVASGPIQIVTPPPEPKRGISPTLIGAIAAIVIFAIIALLLLPKLTAPTTPATLAAGVAGASTATTVSTTAAPQGTATGLVAPLSVTGATAGANEFDPTPRASETMTQTTAPSATAIPPTGTSGPNDATIAALTLAAGANLTGTAVALLPSVTNTATNTVADTATTEPTLTSTPVPPSSTPLVVANAVTAATPLTATSTNTPVPPTVAPTETFTVSPVPPSATSVPPTDTLTKTFTPSPLPPTETPLPTDTVTATFTLTPIPPTSTALPTDTLTLTYTPSPLPPTSTPLPTDTPVPTDTITVTATATTVATAEATLAPTDTQAATQAATVNATAPSGPTTAPGTPRMDGKGVAQVWVPAGCFQMGSDPAKVKGAGKDEQPQHQVCITQGFWLDQNLVTNAEYAAFVSAGGYTNKQYWSDDGWKWLQDNSVTGPQDSKNFTDPQQPRVGVSWYEADAYARWRGGRLPTEAEWEYAARGPQSLTYPWGDTFDKANANVNTKGTTPVGQFAGGKNWVGAFDMSGNVWEWVNDWYSDTYYQQNVTNDPPGPSSGDSRVMRGGAWDYSELFARGASRSDLSPDSQGYDIGFRMVTSAP